MSCKPNKGRFACSFCQKNPSGSKRKRSLLSASLSESGPATSPVSSPLPTPSNTSGLSEAEPVCKSEADQSVDVDVSVSPKGGKRKRRKVSETVGTPTSGGGGEMRALKKLLTTLEKHEDAWPFVFPVNTKAIPQYKKIIKIPMDLSTIKKKLKDGLYKGRDDFYSDMILIFTNCETFNEDDSPVGKAGHSLRNFFELRWADMIA